MVRTFNYKEDSINKNIRWIKNNNYYNFSISFAFNRKNKYNEKQI